jgi:two-component system response regulator PilR (NtrC family)
MSIHPLVGTHARILIVDDEASVRSLLVDLLGDTYRCDAASNAEEALSLIERDSYDVILSDIMMPGMNGIELLGRVRQRKPETTVIMVSANHDTRRAVSALR